MDDKLLCTVFGTAGTIIAGAFGGWDTSIVTLIIFMAIDYVSGFLVAAVFHKSKKSKTGRAESNVCFKGLVRKGMILLMILIGARLDIIIGATYIRDGMCIAFIANELLSIIENAGLMRLPLPVVLTNAIDVLKQKNTETATKNKEDKND